MAARGWGAVSTLAVILGITASWWALALWPLPDDAPGWLTLTREVCFGTTETGLPNAGGWLLLVGQPLGMLLVLFAAWGRDVRAGLARASASVVGQLGLGASAALIIAGLVGVGVRVRTAEAQRFVTSAAESVAIKLNRLNDAPKPMALVNQHGDTITLDRFAGRPVLVTFAFANCSTICPLIVNDVLNVRDRLETLERARPAVVIVTLDPWRDTPARLPSIAERWGVTADAHVLSGPVDDVERTLNAWRIPRVRNQRTGDISHPSIVYVIGPDGMIAYVLNGPENVIRAAVEAL
jgi:cytochrome oxidase Cu insertion factor (SCO1/SenC/PrrC family)